MRKREFERLVAEGFELLPEKFRAKIHNVAFLVEALPSEEVRKEVGLGEEETLLGFYRGIPNTARGADYGVGPTLPDVIHIYQHPTEELAEDMLETKSSPPFEGGDRGVVAEAFKENVRRIVAETVWHEVAHYFGMNEGEVQAREAKRVP